MMNWREVLFSLLGMLVSVIGIILDQEALVWLGLPIWCIGLFLWGLREGVR